MKFRAKSYLFLTWVIHGDMVSVVSWAESQHWEVREEWVPPMPEQGEAWGVHPALGRGSDKEGLQPP